ncbi:hypothetical protein AB0F17_34765 [Nonomuraea sp. NPDC026600]|uniref:hypothetical protein n=1 Tax=Nonomuraea sp. NPDC026600 TaxID=3155363 RepID=UPI0033FFEF82
MANTIQYGTRNRDGIISEHHIARVPSWVYARGMTFTTREPSITVYRVVREDQFSKNHAGEAVTEWAELPADAAVQFGIADASGEVTKTYNPDEGNNLLLVLHAHTGEGHDHGHGHDGGRIVFRAVTVDHRDLPIAPVTEWTPLYPVA